MNEERVIQNMDRNQKVPFSYMNKAKKKKKVCDRTLKVGEKYENDH